jgi:large subunit ribosomal protein L25
MPEMKLNAARREVLGKKTRLLRRQGVTPAHLFGHNLESQSLQCDTTELLKILALSGTTRLVSLKVEDDKEPRNVFVREIQRDVMSRQLLHVDFYQVKKGEKMEMDIPIVLVGEAPAMKGKGRLISRGIDELKIECLPEKVPPQIEVDISILTELEQGIFVKDIILDPDITVHTDSEQLIVKVTEIAIVAEEEKPVVAEAEAPAEEVKAEEGAARPAAETAAEKPEKAEKKE